MDSWGGGGELGLLKCKMAAFMMELMERANDLGGAKAVHSSMGPLSGGASLEEDLGRMAAAGPLISMYMKEEDHQGALDSFSSLLPGGDHPRLDLERARIAVNLILAFGKAEMFKHARFVWASLYELQGDRELELLKAQGSVNFIAALEAEGDARKAQSVYDDLSCPADDLPFAREKAKAAVTLVGLYGRLGLPQKGKQVLSSMPRLQDPEYKHLKSSAGVNLVTAYAMADLWAEALEEATGIASEGITESLRAELLKKLNFVMSKAVNFEKKDTLNILGLFSEN
jgi:hypothetical protein